MKYAIIRPADQTILLYSDLDHCYNWTVSHQEAAIFNSLEEANKIYNKIFHEYEGLTLEKVHDETTWRQQEDTW